MEVVMTVIDDHDHNDDEKMIIMLLDSQPILLSQRGCFGITDLILKHCLGSGVDGQQ